VENPREGHHIYLPISKLHIANYQPDIDGGGYQRKSDPYQVKRIAESWDESMVEVLTVSQRVGGPHEGKLFVVDGQHRLEAARKVFPPTERLLCYVERWTYEQEAERFARQSKNTRKVGTRDLFHARVEACDPAALEVKAIVERQGWRITPTKSPSGHNGITAIGALVSAHKLYGPVILEEAIKVVTDAYGYHNQATDNRIISGVAHFLYHFPIANRRELGNKLGRPESIPKFILQEAAKYGGYGSGRGGAASVSRAILDIYNKNRREGHRLEWDTTKYRRLAIR
jgi:hypothetical protein